MDAIKINNWLTLLANLGVVIGLILLVIELRQNQEIVELEYKLSQLDAAYQEIESLNNFRQYWIEDPELTKIWLDGSAGKAMDEIATERFNGMCIYKMWTDALMYRRSTLLERNTYADAIVTFKKGEIQQYPGLRACWESTKEAHSLWGYDDWVNAVDG